MHGLLQAAFVRSCGVHLQGWASAITLTCRNNSAPVVSAIAVTGSSTVDISSTTFVYQQANSTTGGLLRAAVQLGLLP